MNDRLGIRIIPQQWLTPSFFVSLLSQPLFLNRFNSECFTVSDEPTLDTDGIIDIFIMKNLDWSTAAVSFCKRCQSLERHATTLPCPAVYCRRCLFIRRERQKITIRSSARPGNCLQLSTSCRVGPKVTSPQCCFVPFSPLSRQSFSGKHIAC